MTRHQAILARYIAQHPDVKTGGFMAKLRELGIPDPGYRIIPDGFVASDSEQEIVVVEVEDTSRITPAKRMNYVDTFWQLDGLGWAISLIRIDNYGKVETVDLFDWAMDQLPSEGIKALQPISAATTG